MAGIIKNQILKHLSKFTKNLSPDKISLSAMKGEGDLSNLELDEAVLTDLLALPGWLRLKRATCNKVTIKIQWTKLSKQPICLYLDEVVVQMETCDVTRTPTSGAPVSSYNKGGKYGFAEQIIDGICLSINSVVVNFRSNKFNASIQMSRILVQSKTPKWQDGDLFMTRLKNDLIGEVMIFKEAEWQTLRIEANALDTGDPMFATTPLRLITNQSKIRITIKKKISDCSIVSSRLQVNLDDLLWVLTDSQLTAALTFANALRETIAKSKESGSCQNVDEESKTSTASYQNLTSPHHSQTAGHKSSSSAQVKVGSKSQQQKAKIFDLYNITETSYHLYTGRIDLHLCDDVSPEDNIYQRKVEGGAIQLVLYHLEFDIYPYHHGGESRARWPKYDENMKQRDQWANELLNAFKEDVRTVREVIKANISADNSKNVPKDGVILRPDSNIKPTSQSEQVTYQKERAAGKPYYTELLESCIVVRIEDFMLFRVTTALDSKRSVPRKFLSSDKRQLLLPPEMSSVHIVFTEYYFPNGKDFPGEVGGSVRISGGRQDGFLIADKFDSQYHVKELVPHSNLFMVVNPICLAVDYLTLLWMNMFSLNLAKKVAEIPKKPPSKVHIDIRLDALMPRVILPATDVIGTQGRPGDLEGLQLQMSKVMVTNCRLDGNTSRSELKSTLDTFSSSHLFGKNISGFPNETDDCFGIAKRFYDHVYRKDDGYSDCSVEEILQWKVVNTGQDFSKAVPLLSSPRSSSYYNMTTDSFHLNAEKDVWCVVVDQVWLEFTIVKASNSRGPRTLPLMESFPLKLWLYQFLPGDSETSDLDITLQKSPPNDIKTLSGQLDNLGMAHSVADSSLSNAASYILMNIDVKIQFQIDHDRYWFLLNLIETVSRCSEEIEADFKNITGNVVSPKKAMLSIIVKEVEVALFFPPSKDPSSQITSPDDIGNSPLLLPNGDPETDRHLLMLSDDGCSDSLVIPEISFSSVSPSTEPVEWLVSSEDQMIDYSSVDVGNDAMSLLSDDTEPHLQISNGIASISLSGSRSQSPDQSLSSIPGEIPRSMSRELSFPGSKKAPDIRKSFNQAFSSFTSKLGSANKSGWRTGVNARGMDDTGIDMWDSVSMTSGSLSDDDEDLWERMESQAELPAFEHKRMLQDDGSGADAESDSREDDNSSSLTATLRKKLVSVLIVNIGNIETVVDSYGKDTSLKAVVVNFSMTDGCTMEMEKFQAIILSGAREYTTWNPKISGCQPIARVRFDMGQKAEEAQPGAGDKGFVQAYIDGVKVKLQATTLKSVGELFEDNKPSPPNFLMKATMSNISVTFVDDKMPAYLPEPKNTVIDLFLDHSVITRGMDGIFHMGDLPSSLRLASPAAKMAPASNSSITATSLISNGLRATVVSDKSTEVDINTAGKTSIESENDLLRRQLEKIGKMPCCRKECHDVQVRCIILEKVEMENCTLRRELEHQVQENQSMSEEREALLNVIRKLQDDLLYSERMRARPMTSS